MSEELAAAKRRIEELERDLEHAESRAKKLAGFLFWGGWLLLLALLGLFVFRSLTPVSDPIPAQAPVEEVAEERPAPQPTAPEKKKPISLPGF